MEDSQKQSEITARTAKHVSVSQFYKGAQVQPQYPANAKAEEDPAQRTRVVREDFAYGYAKKTRMYGLVIYVETLWKAGHPEDNVKRPEGINANEWAAAHIVALHNFANGLYQTFCQDPGAKAASSKPHKKTDSSNASEEAPEESTIVCTQQSCPTMTAGSRAEYLWADGRTVRMPTSIPAPKYIYHVLQWLHFELADSGNFPTRDFATYGHSFLSIYAKRCLKRLFRVFAHFRVIHRTALPNDWRKRFDAVLLHMLYFVQEHKYVDSKEFSVLHRVYDDHRKTLKKQVKK